MRRTNFFIAQRLTWLLDCLTGGSEEEKIIKNMLLDKIRELRGESIWDVYRSGEYVSARLSYPLILAYWENKEDVVQRLKEEYTEEDAERIAYTLKLSVFAEDPLLEVELLEEDE